MILLARLAAATTEVLLSTQGWCILIVDQSTWTTNKAENSTILTFSWSAWYAHLFILLRLACLSRTWGQPVSFCSSALLVWFFLEESFQHLFIVFKAFNYGVGGRKFRQAESWFHSQPNWSGVCFIQEFTSSKKTAFHRRLQRMRRFVVVGETVQQPLSK